MFMVFLSCLAVAQAKGIFEYDRIVFFSTITRQENSPQTEPEQSPEIIADEWAEPIIAPSGKVSIYVPPKEVKDFLDKPDPENAKAYLEWNLKRIKKFVLAQELLRKEAEKLENTKEAKTLLESVSPANGINNAKSGAGYLFYFMLKGCPFCEKESRIIEDIYLNYPKIRVEAFAKGFSDQELSGFRFPVRQDNGMSALFKVELYPSVIVFNKRNQKYFLSGFADKERILQLLQ